MLAAAATGIQVGLAIVATRLVIEQTHPASLAFLRYLIGFCCLLPATLGVRVRFEPRDLLPIGLLGIAQFGLLIALMNYGLQFIPSARAALIFATTPLLTLGVSALLGQERLTLAKALGVLLTMLGVALVLGEKALAPDGPASQWLGELAVLGSALCGAVCSVLYRPYLRKYPTVPMGALAMLASVGFLAVLAGGEGFFSAWPSLNATGWAAVGFIGVSSGVGYFLWLWALGHVSATRVTVFLSLSPITAALLGALLLSEPLTLWLVAGLVCVVAGLWVTNTEATQR